MPTGIRVAFLKAAAGRRSPGALVAHGLDVLHDHTILMAHTAVHFHNEIIKIILTENFNSLKIEQF